LVKKSGFLLALFVLLMYNTVECADRCMNYTSTVRSQAVRYLGFDYPYWYLLGQCKQESQCRADVRAFDGGMGISQFMPATAKDINRQLGGGLNPYNPDHAIKMQAFYMSQIHKRNKTKKLFIDFQGYNGGEGNIKKELQKAEIADWSKMKSVCNRKVITLKNGSKLDFCQVNYDYSKRIFGFGKIYKQGQDYFVFW